MLVRRSPSLSLLLSSAVVAALAVAPALGQEAPAAETPAASAPAKDAVDPKLKGLADDFLHYSLVANIDLAKDSGQAILNSGAAPRDILAAFEAGANERPFREILVRNQRQEGLKEVSKQLLEKIEQGYRDSARDPERIKADIERLDDSPRAYVNGRDHLMVAGPFAVPYYIQYLQDPKKADLQPYIIRVMGEVGRPLLPPLLQDLQTPDTAAKVTLVNIIGAIGYPQSVPYLKAILADEKTPADLRKATESALARSDERGGMLKLSASDAYLVLANQYYQKRNSVPAPYPTEPTNPVWYFDANLNNVVAVPVPTAIWSSVETLRACEASLKLKPDNAPAISLWLAADFRRELQLPADQKDPTRSPNAMDASFYALNAGPVYLNTVLKMALDDHDSALILKTLSALEATAGAQGLANAKQGATPLVQALSYPDRAVRFSAAFALARANPSQPFPGSFRVVPVLAEALSQTGTPNLLLIEPNQDNRNRLKAALTAANPPYNVFDAATVSGALENARRAAAFDAIILPANTNDLPALREAAKTDYRLAPAPVLLLTSKDALETVKAMIADNKGLKELPADADDKAVAEAIAAAKTNIGQTPIDQTAANAYTATAIKLLGAIAADHASVYNVSEAVPALIDLLKDKRPEAVSGAAQVLAQLNSPEAEKAIAAVALTDNADNAFRVTLLTALANSAKQTGNALDAGSIDKLIKLVSSESDATVKTAAATALGALNVQSNQASKLILQQAR